MWHYEYIHVNVKPLDAPFGPSYDLNCAENAEMNGLTEEIRSLRVQVEHYGVTVAVFEDPIQELIQQTVVNVTNAGPTVIQLNQVIRCFGTYRSESFVALTCH